MNVLTIVIVVFSILGALDYLFGSKFHIGKEFEKGFMLLGTMALSMIGMIVIAPWIATQLSPVFNGVYKVFKLDPSILPASLFANDMGGAPLSVAVAKDTEMGLFNALVVSSMMGCTISFTLPFALNLVDEEHHRQMAFGLLAGVITIPVGCFVAGLVCRLKIGALLYNLLPLTILAVVIALGILFAPNACVKIFKGVGFFMKVLVVTGLACGILNFLADEPLIKGMGTLEEGAMICVNASVVMTGMFPLIYLLSKALAYPLKKLGGRLEMKPLSITGVLSSLATSATTFGVMNDMDDKGIMVNSAFAVSGAFTFAGHMAFTMAFDKSYLLPVIVGKLTAGTLALVLAFFLYGKLNKTQKSK